MKPRKVWGEPSGPSEVKPGRSTFIESLEAAARAVASSNPRLKVDDEVSGGLEDELGLTLGQIQRLRVSNRRAREALTDLECEVGSELLGMDTERWWYGTESMARWRDRRRLKGQLATLVQHRLRSEEEHDRSMVALEDRLLSLLHRHAATRDE